MENKFINKIDSNYCNKPATKIRWRKSLDFIGDKTSLKSQCAKKGGPTSIFESRHGYPGPIWEPFWEPKSRF